MSYSGTRPTEEELTAMKSFVPKGTVVEGKYEVLEDTTAHGCPWVKNLETGEEFCKTLYLHTRG